MGATWYAQVGTYFNVEYTWDPIDRITVVTPINGLNAVSNNGNLRIYGTPTQTGTMHVVVTYWDPEIEDSYDENFYVIVSPPPQYTHTIAYNANGGSGSMGNTTVTDSNSGNTNVTFAANSFSAPAGHYFAGWRINNTGTVYQPGNTYPVGGNGSATAYAYWLPNSYTVSVTAGTGGTVSGGGTYTYGSTATITATPSAHYHFTSWSDGSTSASRSFTVTGNVSLTAYFAIDTHTVTLTAGPGGSVSGGGTYNYGATATITATPDPNYKFVQWSDGDTNASRTITVTGNITLSATFAPAIAKVDIKTGGVWTQGSVYVKAGGAWVESKKIYIKTNGQWIEKSN